MSPLLSYRPSLDAITDKRNLLANDHIEIKSTLLEACRKYGSKGLNKDFLSLENSNFCFFLYFNTFYCLGYLEIFKKTSPLAVFIL